MTNREAEDRVTEKVRFMAGRELLLLAALLL
jgi:hypothetical protein